MNSDSQSAAAAANNSPRKLPSSQSLRRQHRYRSQAFKEEEMSRPASKKSSLPSSSTSWLGANDDDDFEVIGVPADRSSSYGTADPPKKRKAGRPPKPRMASAPDDYELVVGGIQTHPLASKEQRADLMKLLIENQPEVATVNIQPRNKTAYNTATKKAAKKASDLGPAEFIGTSYNAFRMMALSVDQLNHLKVKLGQVAWDVRPDGCYVSRRVKKQRGTVADQAARGTQLKCLQLDATYKGVFVDASFECVHIQLYAAGKYPPTSEHEVSHLCHNPLCVNLDHLCWEFHPDNHAREQCRWTRGLKCPNCAHSFSLCPHTPKCVPCTCAERDDEAENEGNEHKED